LYITEVLPHIYEHSVRHSLTTQTGTSGAQGQRHSLSRAGAHEGPDLVRAASSNNGLRNEKEMGGIMGGSVSINCSIADLGWISHGRSKSLQHVNNFLSMGSSCSHPTVRHEKSLRSLSSGDNEHWNITRPSQDWNDNVQAVPGMGQRPPIERKQL